jgi:hypothetical protein
MACAVGARRLRDAPVDPRSSSAIFQALEHSVHHGDRDSIVLSAAVMKNERFGL